MPHPSDGILNIGWTLFTHEIFSGFLWSIIHDLVVEIGRPASLQDESVGDFIRRRFDSDVGDNIVSAVLHGIYAGDIYSLSVKSLLPTLWEAEARSADAGSVIWGLRKMWQKGVDEYRTNVDLFTELKHGFCGQDKERAMSDAQIRLVSDIKKSSVFTLRGGLGQLADELVNVLKRRKNISIRTDCPVQEISQTENKVNEMSISTSLSAAANSSSSRSV